MELSIVMPVYNEAKVLASTLDEALTATENAPFDYEIVLVDDASRDESLEILMEYQSRHPERIRVLSHEKNKGIMGALQTLFSSARGKFIFFNSSDGQFKTADCMEMMKHREEFDLIVGRREKKLYDVRRHIISYLFNLLPKILFGVETFDAGSVKLYRRELLSIPLLSRSPFMEAERIIRAKHDGYRIGAVDVTHHQRRAGRATGADWDLLKESVQDLFRCWRLFFFLKPFTLKA